jgi:hypothetical protein
LPFVIPRGVEESLPVSGNPLRNRILRDVSTSLDVTIER